VLCACKKHYLGRGLLRGPAPAPMALLHGSIRRNGVLTGIVDADVDEVEAQPEPDRPVTVVDPDSDLAVEPALAVPRAVAVVLAAHILLVALLHAVAVRGVRFGLAPTEPHHVVLPAGGVLLGGDTAALGAAARNEAAGLGAVGERGRADDTAGILLPEVHDHVRGTVGRLRVRREDEAAEAHNEHHQSDEPVMERMR
jgi:hypothetical protein